MKFFVLAISCLVCSITIPKSLVAQDGLLTANPKIEEKKLSYRPEFRTERKPVLDTSGGEKTVEFNKSFSERRATFTVNAKVLKQMQHEQEISAQFLELLAVETSHRDFISLEATLVDLKGQCSASYDRLLDLEDGGFPKPCQQFYQVLLNQFVPKAEALLEVAWKGNAHFFDKEYDQEYEELKEFLSKVEEYYDQL